MGWLEAITGWVSALAWPTAITVLIFKLKAEIAALFTKIGDRIPHTKSFKGPGGIEVEFEGQIREVKQVAAAAKAEGGVSSEVSIRGTAVAKAEGGIPIDLRGLAHANPAAAVIASGGAIEVWVRQAFERSMLGTNSEAQTLDTSRLIEGLKAADVINSKTAEGMEILIKLGRMARDEPSWDPSTDQAVELIDTGSLFFTEVSNLAAAGAPVAAPGDSGLQMP